MTASNGSNTPVNKAIIIVSTYLIMHSVQESGYHRENSGSQCVQIIRQPTNISLKIANLGSMHYHHSLSEEKS